MYFGLFSTFLSVSESWLLLPVLNKFTGHVKNLSSDNEWIHTEFEVQTGESTVCQLPEDTILHSKEKVSSLKMSTSLNKKLLCPPTPTQMWYFANFAAWRKYCDSVIAIHLLQLAKLCSCCGYTRACVTQRRQHRQVSFIILSVHIMGNMIGIRLRWAPRLC